MTPNGWGRLRTPNPKNYADPRDCVAAATGNAGGFGVGVDDCGRRLVGRLRTKGGTV